MTGLTELVGRLYADFDAATTMTDLRQLVRWDRFQASAGIESAAEWVAQRARLIGLDNVQVLRFQADGSRQWWTYSAPQAWTPVAARLSVVDAVGLDSETIVDYPAQPYRLAAQSAAASDLLAPLVRWSERSGPGLTGSVVLLDEPSVPFAAAYRALSNGGAAGVVVGGLDGDMLAHRLELPNGSALFGFSLPAAELSHLLRHADRGALARVSISIDHQASTPVVVAELPGREPGSAMAYAHLCHQAPGANDNASGVVTTLAVARLLAGRRAQLRRGVRFVWGPEFVGLAAYLHHIEADQRPGRFDIAINLDMVGEVQRSCGGPLIIERSADHLPSYLSALTEWCVRLLPEQGRSYSGAIACDTWAWRATPFVGASDHLLLADRSIGCPSVQLGHWPDRFHHSSEDTLDKVDPAELRRAGTVAAAVLAASCESGPDDLNELESVVGCWGAQMLYECAQRPPAAIAPAAGEIDPWAPANYRALLEHRRGLAVDSVASLARLDGGLGDGRRDRLVTWMNGLAAHLAQLPGQAAERSDDATISAQDRTRLEPAWLGPFNLRGLQEDANEADRAWLDRQLADGGTATYARFVALAYAIDGSRTLDRAVRWASFASQLPISPAWARRFFDVMRRTGWLRANEAAGRQRS